MKRSIPYTGTQVQSSFFVNIYFRTPPLTLRAMIFPQYGHRGRMQRRRCGLRRPLGLVQILRIRRRQHRHPTGHRFPLCTRHRGRRRGGTDNSGDGEANNDGSGGGGGGWSGGLSEQSTDTNSNGSGGSGFIYTSETPAATLDSATIGGKFLLTNTQQLSTPP